MGLFSKKISGAEQDNDLVNSFINKSEGLQRILEKETEYFRQMKIKQAEMLIETKLSLIDEIEAIKSTLVRNPNLLKNISENDKKKIRVSNDSLMQAAQSNYDETLKAKEVNKLILEAISEAVSQNNSVEGAYGKKGSAYSSSSDVSPIAIIQSA